MKIVSYVILLAVAGLIVGYLIYGRDEGIFINPWHILIAPAVSDENAEKVPFDLEKIRSQIYSAGLIGGVLGLAIGFLRRGKKRPSFF
jgi:hypothetical protein